MNTYRIEIDIWIGDKLVRTERLARGHDADEAQEALIYELELFGRKFGDIYSIRREHTA